jgi:hypothetical protein
MDWPTATFLIAVVAAAAVVLAVGLRVLGDVLARRDATQRKRKELIEEAAAELKAQVAALRREAGRPDP